MTSKKKKETSKMKSSDGQESARIGDNSINNIKGQEPPGSSNNSNSNINRQESPGSSNNSNSNISGHESAGSSSNNSNNNINLEEHLSNENGNANDEFSFNPQASEFIPSYFMAPTRTSIGTNREHFQQVPNKTQFFSTPDEDAEDVDEVYQFQFSRRRRPVENGFHEEEEVEEQTYMSYPTLGPFIPIDEIQRVNPGRYEEVPVYQHQDQQTRLQFPLSNGPTETGAPSYIFDNGVPTAVLQNKPIFLAPAPAPPPPPPVVYTPLFSLVGYMPTTTPTSQVATSSNINGLVNGVPILQPVQIPQNGLNNNTRPLVQQPYMTIPQTPPQQLQHIGTLPLQVQNQAPSINVYQHVQQQQRPVFTPIVPQFQQLRPSTNVNVVIPNSPGSNQNPNGFPTLVPYILPQQNISRQY